MKLQIRGIHGEHTETEGGVYDISNKARLGVTEYQAVKQMYDGVKKLIEMEKACKWEPAGGRGRQLRTEVGLLISYAK